jgi:hypothetical protein
MPRKWDPIAGIFVEGDTLPSDNALATPPESSPVNDASVRFPKKHKHTARDDGALPSPIVPSLGTSPLFSTDPLIDTDDTGDDLPPSVGSLPPPEIGS